MNNRIADSVNSKFPITIITVVRNNAATIKQAMFSVFNQTYLPIEFIVIDGVSTDGTIEIIKDFEEKIRNKEIPKFQLYTSNNIHSHNQLSVFRWISEPDTGIYDALNKGIDMANGAYIGVLHSNDWFEISTCEIIAKEIEKDNLGMDLYYGMIRVFSVDGLHLKTYGSTMNLIKKEMIAHPSCFIKQSIYKNIKYDLKYKSAADYELMLKLSTLEIRSKFIEKVITNFRLGGLSDTYSGGIETIKLLYKYGNYSFFEYLLRVSYLRLLLIFKHKCKTIIKVYTKIDERISNQIL